MLLIETSKKKPIVVLGDGWSACATVGFLMQAGKDVCWVKGTGARMAAPLPSIEVGAAGGMGLQGWVNLGKQFGIDGGEAETGCFIREFRNKAFREPHWTKAPTPETRVDVRNESLWAPECRIAAAFEARLDLTVSEIEEPIRARLLSGEFKKLRRVEEFPVLSVLVQDDVVKSVMLGSGEVIECAHLVFADRWGAMREVQGLPAALQKAVISSRKREPVSVMQATFTHSTPLAVGIKEAFYALLNKEAGEEIDRHVWGYFSSDGLKSFWTLCLSRDEVEDNHEIAKKLRRMKSALDKMFAGSAWLPEKQPSFLGTIASEHVRFEENFLFSQSSWTETEEEVLPLARKVEGLTLMTDGFGSALALHQVAQQIPAAAAAIVEETSENADAGSADTQTAETESAPAELASPEAVL